MSHTVGSTVLLVSLTYLPLLLSLLSFYPEIFSTHPILHFLLCLSPWWIAYLSARWYIRLAEKSSPFYHPLGCLSQCCVWVFHWIVSLYHACFATRFSMWTYLITIFCIGIGIITEGLFHSLIAMDSSDNANMGVYEHVRKAYGQGLVLLVKLWYLADMGSPPKQSWTRTPLRSRSMTL